MDPNRHVRPRWIIGNSLRGPYPHQLRPRPLNFNFNFNPSLPSGGLYRGTPSSMRFNSSLRINNPQNNRRPPLMFSPRDQSPFMRNSPSEYYGHLGRYPRPPVRLALVNCRLVNNTVAITDAPSTATTDDNVVPTTKASTVTTEAPPAPTLEIKQELIQKMESSAPMDTDVKPDNETNVEKDEVQTLLEEKIADVSDVEIADVDALNKNVESSESKTIEDIKEKSSYDDDNDDDGVEIASAQETQTNVVSETKVFENNSEVIQKEEVTVDQPNDSFEVESIDGQKDQAGFLKTDLGEILRRSSRERKTNTRIIQDSITPGMKLPTIKTTTRTKSTSPPMQDSGAARTNVIVRRDPKLKNSISMIVEQQNGLADSPDIVVAKYDQNDPVANIKDSITKRQDKARKSFVEGQNTLENSEKRQRKRFFKGSTYHLSLSRVYRKKKKPDDGGSDTASSNAILDNEDNDEPPPLANDVDSTSDNLTMDASNVDHSHIEDGVGTTELKDGNFELLTETSGVSIEPTDMSVRDLLQLKTPIVIVKKAVKPLLIQNEQKRKRSSVDVPPVSSKFTSPISRPGSYSPPAQPIRIPEIHNGDQGKRIPTITLHQPTPLLCTCRKIEGFHMSNEPLKRIFCQGIDCIDNRLIGCVNAVTVQELFRAAARVPFQALCEIHKQRLKRHQCCPGCGLFCSQGNFIQCRADSGKSFHHSHKDCLLMKDNKEVCPHCGEGSNLQEVCLELNAPRPPSFFHKQQPVRKEPGARMAFTKGNENPHSFEAPGSPTSRSYTLDQSGMEISSAGLPMGPDRSQLEDILGNLSRQTPTNLRYSIKHMYSAAKNGDVEKILQMLMMGLDQNTKFEDQSNCTPLHVAAANGHLALVHVLVQASAFLDALDDSLQTPLIYAIENGQTKICEYLIKAGAQLEARQAEDGMTALHLAAKAGQLDVVKQILDTGKVNVNIQDDGGWTPLVWAAEHRHLVVVKYLLKRGGDPNIRDNERNIALHWSSFSGSLEISETFLNHGCDLNSANEHGDTPLHIAARQDKYECVMLLLARSADVDAQNKEGETPLMCCPDTSSQTWLALSMTKHLKKISVSRTLRTERILHQDISRGKEQSPIQCINGIDDDPAPSDYLYIIENCETVPVNVERSISNLQSCRCEDDCTSTNCQCSAMSLRCWFDKDGKLMENFNLFDPPMIFECNRACLCWATCHNRVLQRGITCRLQLFRTKGKGWGVRALKDIPRGSFICEYVGELISDQEADQREDDSYLFDLDNRDGETYCIDARRYGNISRFINHLCEPNLIPVKVFVEYQDLRFPRIALFSSRNIRAYEELGFDYGDKFWVIKYKMFTCTCASDKCKYSNKTIHSTLANYDKRLREEQEENGGETL